MADNVVNYQNGVYDLEHSTRGSTSFYFWQGHNKHALFTGYHTRNPGAVYRVESVDWTGVSIQLNNKKVRKGDLVNLHHNNTVDVA